MNRQCTIAHLSDLHISLDHSRHNARNMRRLLEYCLAHNADHIVVTGDIAANAEKKELEAARKIFRSFGLLDPEKLTLVIGNHDVFGGVHHAHDILQFPKRCRETNYERRLNMFKDTFHEVFEGSVHGKGNKFYPFIKIVSGVALVGINSIARYARVRNPLGSNGEVDNDQFKRLERFLNMALIKNLHKVVLIHHHFNSLESAGAGTLNNVWNAIEAQTLKLRKKKRLLELFQRSGVELVLHGHVHENREYVRKGIRFVNTGAALLGSTSTSHATLITADLSGLQTQLHTVHHVAKPASAADTQRNGELILHEAA